MTISSTLVLALMPLAWAFPHVFPSMATVTGGLTCPIFNQTCAKFDPGCESSDMPSQERGYYAHRNNYGPLFGARFESFGRFGDFGHFGGAN